MRVFIWQSADCLGSMGLIVSARAGTPTPDSWTSSNAAYDEALDIIVHARS